MRKSSYIVSLLIVFMMYSNTLKAQWHKWQFGGGVGSLTYYGDLSDRFVNANLQELGYHAFVERKLSPKAGIYWRLESINGHLLGSDRAPGGWINGKSPDFDRSLNFRTRIHDVNTAFVFYFGNQNKRATAPFLNAYLKAGIGIGFFDVRGDLKDANGNFYNYWSDRTIRDIPENAPNASDAQVVKRDYDFETDILAYEVETEYNRFKWQIPVALGLKMKLSNAVSLLLEAQFTYAMTDYLDNVGDEKVRSNSSQADFIRVADPNNYIGDRPRNLDKPTGVHDAYLYVNAGLSFNVGSTAKPKPKTPTFYPKVQFFPTDTSSADTLKVDSLSKEKEAHPFEQMINASQQTYGEDTIGNHQKEKLTYRDSLEQDDSLFIELFQYNHKTWLSQDSLTSSRTIDSVVITKLPDVEQKYLVYYYDQLNDSTEKNVVVKIDTITLNTEKKNLLRDNSVYSTGETYYRIGEIGDTIPSELLRNETTNDSTLQLILEMKKQLEQIEKQYQLDTQKNISKQQLDSNKIDTNVISPANYRFNVAPKQDTSVKTFESTPIQIDSTYNKVKDDLKLKIAELEKSQTLKLDSIYPVVNDSTAKLVDSTSLKVVKDTSNTTLKDSTEIYQKRLDDLKKRIQEAEKSKSVQDTISKKDTTVSKSIDAKPFNTSSTTVNDTIRVVQVDSTAFKQKAEELEIRNKELETANRKLDSLRSAYDKVAKDTSSSNKNQVSKSEMSNKKDSAADSLANQVDQLKAQIQQLDAEAKRKADSISMMRSEIEVQTPSNQRTINEKSIQSNTDDDEMKKRIAQLEEQIQLQKIKSDSIQNISRARSVENQRWTNEEVEATQKALENRIDELENQLKTTQNNPPKRKASDQEFAAQQRKIDSLNQEIVNYRYQSDMLRRDGYIPQYQSSQPKVGFQPVIEPVISVPIGGGNRREARRQAKAEAKAAETTSDNNDQKLVVGFNHDGKPGFIESRRMEKQGVNASVEDSLNIEDSLSVVNNITDDNVDTLDSVKNNTRIITNSLTNNDTKAIEEENAWLKSQISDIQKSQDSLLSILQDILLKSNQAPTVPAAPIVVEKEVVREVKAEIDSNALIQGILHQPSTKVFFAVGKSSVAAQYKTSLDQLAQQLKSYPSLKIELVGYADPTGNAAANMQLSEKRAQAVKNYLIQTHRISASRIIVLPVGQEDGSQDMSYSRRVEVKLIQ